MGASLSAEEGPFDRVDAIKEQLFEFESRLSSIEQEHQRSLAEKLEAERVLEQSPVEPKRACTREKCGPSTDIIDASAGATTTVT